MSHELTGNSIAEVVFANRNRIVKREVQLNSTTAIKGGFCDKIQNSTELSDIPLVNNWYVVNTKCNVLK